jgi:hypothetical protein
MKRIALACALLVATALPLTAGAGDGATPSGLRGLVTRGPVQPVCRGTGSCDEPAVGVTLRFSRSGRVVARATTNRKGWYSVQLRPGRYSVRTNRRGPEAIPLPAGVTVPRGRTARRDFSLDTGLR